MRRNFFFFPSGRWTATSARGLRGVVEPEIVSEALKTPWRREAICLSVQVLNIWVCLYTVYFVVWRPFCDNLTILSQNLIVTLWVNIHFWSKKSPLCHSLVLSMKFRLKSFLAWITIWKSQLLSLYNVFLDVKLPRMSWTPLYEVIEILLAG